MRSPEKVFGAMNGGLKTIIELSEVERTGNCSYLNTVTPPTS